MSTQFAWIDWIFVMGFLIVSACIGIMARKRVSTLADFLLVGRKLRTVWGIATLSSTEMGLVTIVYFSEESYSNGFVALATAFITALTMWTIGRTGFVINKLRSLHIMTVPEYFEKRYNANIRWIAGVLTFITGVLTIGIFLQVEGKFLIIIMGLDGAYLPAIMGILLVIVIAYTMLGGMYSVVFTDVFQFVMIFVGIIFTTYFSFIHADGFTGIVAAVRDNYGDAGFRIWQAPKYGLLVLIWMVLYYTSGWSSWQPVVQRVLSMKDAATSQKLFQISSIFIFFRAAMPMLWGIAALAVLGKVGDPKTALPLMLTRILPAGIIGFITVGFLAASMSTYDSYLLSFSSILVQDVVARHCKNPLTEKQRILLMRIGILVLGIFIYLWGVFYVSTESVLRYIILAGSISYAGIITALVGGIYWKRADTFGVYCAFIISAVPPLVCLAAPEKIDSTQAGLLSFALAPICLVAGSLLRPSPKSDFCG